MSDHNRRGLEIVIAGLLISASWMVPVILAYAFRA
jgi:hypothetical protein